MPDGTRRLSSSTSQWSARSRTRSMPATAIRTASAGNSLPSRFQPGASSTTGAGITPSATIRALGVDVAQERLQRAHPLGEPGGEAGPVLGGDDARHQVEREQPVRLAVADPEGDAAGALLGAQRRLGGGQAARAEPVQRAEHPAVVRQHRARLR